MTSYLIVGDLHAAERPPARRDEHYFDDCMWKLDQIVEMSKDVDAVIFIGDLFHSKRANHVTHRLVIELGRRLSKMGNVHILPGNHDLADGSLESLERQPLTALAQLPNVSLLAGEPGKVWWIASRSFLAVPGTGEVCDAKDDALRWFRTEELERVDCILAHAPISIENKPWPTWHPDSLAIEDTAGCLVYGHQHDKAGEKHGFPKTYATGAVMRGAISEAENEPAVLRLTLADDISCEVLPLQCRPSSEVYRWAERLGEQNDNAAMDAFVAALGTQQLVGFSREGLIAEIRERDDLPPEIRSSAVKILEEV